jgi:hypothetical protein
LLNEAYAALKSDNGLWPALAQRINITDPAVAAYRDQEQRINNPPYSAGLIGTTQAMPNAIVGIAGEQGVGVGEGERVVDDVGVAVPRLPVHRVGHERLGLLVPAAEALIVGPIMHAPAGPSAPSSKHMDRHHHGRAR